MVAPCFVPTARCEVRTDEASPPCPSRIAAILGHHMDPSVVGGLLLVAILIIANGVFVATEFGYVRARRARLEARAEAGSRGARTVLAARVNLDRYIAASQLGITMASLALGFVGEPLFAAAIEPPIEALVGGIAPALAHAVAIAFAFFLITSLHIVFGELAPKTIALTRPEATAIFVSGPIRWFSAVFNPLITLLNGTGNVILRSVGIATTPIGEEARLTGRDLMYAVESSASVGAISRREQRLAERAIELGELRVRELMQPRDRIVSVDIADDRAAVLGAIGRHRHSRYPVVRGGLDEPLGLIDARDVVLGDPATDWQSSVRPIATVPDSMTLGRALDDLSAGAAMIALVADEYGNVDGMIALGDIVEFLAGRCPTSVTRRTRVRAVLATVRSSSPACTASMPPGGLRCRSTSTRRRSRPSVVWSPIDSSVCPGSATA